MIRRLHQPFDSVYMQIVTRLHIFFIDYWIYRKNITSSMYQAFHMNRNTFLLIEIFHLLI